MAKEGLRKVSRQDVLLAVGVVLALCVVLVLTVVTVFFNSAASGTLNNAPPFALGSLISDKEDEENSASLAEYVFPAFIGIVNGTDGLGISVGDDVVMELYSMLSPCLASGLTGVPTAYTAVGWELLRSSDRAIYIKYHSALPIAIVQGAAAAVCGTEEYTADFGGKTVRELFLLLPNEQYGDCQIILRTMEGDILRYVCDPQEKYPTLAETLDFTQSFRTSFFRFALGSEKTSSTEPVFQERIRTRNVRLVNETARMMTDNRKEHQNALLRLFDFNPDKLNTHEEADSILVAVESHGIMRIQPDRFLYTAGLDGGVSLQQFIGYREQYTLFDNIRSACTVVQKLREMYKFYMGGDAEVLLTGVFRQGEQIRMEFRYVFDNLLLENCDPAMAVTVEKDKVLSVDIYAIGVLSRGEFQAEYLESGVLESIGTENITDMTMAYRVDMSLLDRDIFPVWTYYREQ